MFTPGGMGATLSPTSAIFFTTVPVNGALMTVFCSCASADVQIRCDLLARRPMRAARRRCAWPSAASINDTRLFAASSESTGSNFSPLRRSATPELATRLGQVGLCASDLRLRRPDLRIALLHLRPCPFDRRDESVLSRRASISPSRTTLPSSTRSSDSRPWILDDTIASRRATM